MRTPAPGFDRLIAVFALSFTLAGCATKNYRYVVASPASSSQNTPRTEAFYAEPPEANEGSVRVRSLGLVDLRPKGEETRIPALHVRTTLMKAAGTGSWLFNIEEQTLTFPDRAPMPPLYANSDAPGLPNLQIQTGETRSVDLYFPLPDKKKSESDVTNFEFRWTVHSDNRILSETTAFERAPTRESYPAVYPYEPYPIGFGSMWWGTWRPIPVQPAIRIRK